MGDGWAYEPKWDGFRAVVEVGEDGARIHSRGGRPLNRYFPELAFPVPPCVLDGEIVVRGADGTPSFETLQGRIHPAESRVRRLAEETPATFIAFDLLASGGEELLGLPLAERRRALEALVVPPLELTPSSTDPAVAAGWLREGEGVVAKRLDAPYRPGERHGMVKVKRVRTLDCVVIGYRPGTEPDTVGSLILALHDAAGELRVVGHAGGFRSAEKRALVSRLAPFVSGGHGSGGPSRWSGGRNLEWVGLRPELVVEVAVDHVSGGRIRHGARLLRWREDRRPQECVVDQLLA